MSGRGGKVGVGRLPVLTVPALSITKAQGMRYDSVNVPREGRKQMDRQNEKFYKAQYKLRKKVFVSNIRNGRGGFEKEDLRGRMGSRMDREGGEVRFQSREEEETSRRSNRHSRKKKSLIMPYEKGPVCRIAESGPRGVENPPERVAKRGLTLQFVAKGAEEKWATLRQRIYVTKENEQSFQKPSANESGTEWGKTGQTGVFRNKEKEGKVRGKSKERIGLETGGRR